MATPGTWQIFSLGGMQYQLLLPNGYTANQTYPVLLFLHGGGEENLLPNMIDPWFNTAAFRTNYPAIVIAPQLQNSSLYNNWGGYGVGNDDNQNEALAILRQVMSQYSSDPSRVYVTGLSLGGYATWDLMIKYNAYTGVLGQIFAGGVVLSGDEANPAYSIQLSIAGGVPTPDVISELKNVPVWAIEGGFNRGTWNQALFAALPGSTTFHWTLDPTLSHDTWDKWYSLPTGAPVYDWLFSQSARGPGGLSNIAVIDNTTSVPVAPVAHPYTGPVQSLWNEYIAITNDSLNVAVGSSGWFIHTGSGTDAIRASSGTNVLDGGSGSNFLTGGSGTDTFFVDDRSASADIWSTIANFHTGDAATIWGITQADFSIAWQDGQGAAGFTGLTMHASAPGKATASVSLAGYSQADLSNGRLSVSFGTDAASGSAYMYIHAN
jgi:Ca2+-binding RTX toxin-like protein